MLKRGGVGGWGGGGRVPYSTASKSKKRAHSRQGLLADVERIRAYLGKS